MTIRKIAELLEAKVILGEDKLDLEVDMAFSSDMMSDVLAYVKHDALLLTGLVNAHVVRTAEMMDIPCIVFVRGKRPAQDVLDVAEECGIALLSTEHTMFTACGKLYASGLTGSAGRV